jgi:hypothetical protein
MWPGHRLHLPSVRGDRRALARRVARSPSSADPHAPRFARRPPRFRQGNCTRKKCAAGRVLPTALLEGTLKPFFPSILVCSRSDPSVGYGSEHAVGAQAADLRRNYREPFREVEQAARPSLLLPPWPCPCGEGRGGISRNHPTRRASRGHLPTGGRYRSKWDSSAR